MNPAMRSAFFQNFNSKEAIKNITNSLIYTDAGKEKTLKLLSIFEEKVYSDNTAKVEDNNFIEACKVLSVITFTQMHSKYAILLEAMELAKLTSPLKEETLEVLEQYLVQEFKENLRNYSFETVDYIIEHLEATLDDYLQHQEEINNNLAFFKKHYDTFKQAESELSNRFS